MLAAKALGGRDAVRRAAVEREVRRERRVAVRVVLVSI